MVLLVLLNGAIQILSGQRIRAGDGLGYDGILYGRIVMDPHKVLFEEGLDRERLRRVLPSLLIHATLRTLGLPTGDIGTIVLSFQLYNLILLAASAAVYGAIADRMGFGRAARWIGFCALFVNHGTARFPFYYAVLTDTTAFALSMLMLLLYLRGSQLGLAATLALGSFTWSSLFPWGAVLLIFPLSPALRPGTGGRGKDLVALTAALVYVALALYTAFVIRPEPWWIITPIAYPVLPLTILLSALYLFRGTQQVLDFDWAGAWRGLRSSISATGLALAVAVMLAIRAVGQALHARPGIPFHEFFVGDYKALVTQSIVLPLFFVVNNLDYFGPIAVVIVLYWRSICRLAHGLGPGPTLFLAATMGISLTTESRHLLHTLPMLAILAVRAIAPLRPGWGFCTAFGVASLILSRAWILTGDLGPLEGTALGLQPDWYNWLNGPWMSRRVYVLYAMATLLVAVGTLVLLPGGVRSPEPPREGDGGPPVAP